jgi:hypothetical protein
MEFQRRAERLEREHEERIKGRQKEAEQSFEQERQRLEGELEREREERLKAQRELEHLEEQERLDLEHEQERVKEKLEYRSGQTEAPRPWWRKPILVAALLFSALAVWLASLVVALALLYP